MKRLSFIVILFILFLPSCTWKERLSSNQVDKIIFFAMPKGLEFSHGVNSVSEVIRNGRDTIINDRPFIRTFVREVNLLRPGEEQTSDFRSAALIIKKDGDSICVLFGERFGIKYDGMSMKGRQSIFSFINKKVYSLHSNTYWFPNDTMRSFIQEMNTMSLQAKENAWIIKDNISSLQTLDSTLLALLPNTFMCYTLLFQELSSLYTLNNPGLSDNVCSLVMNQLYRSPFIDYNMFIEKVTTISTEAYLPCDDSALVLQQTIWNLLRSRPLSIISTLNTKSEEENNQFWVFVYKTLPSASTDDLSTIHSNVLDSIRLNRMDYQYLSTMDRRFEELVNRKDLKVP